MTTNTAAHGVQSYPPAYLAYAPPTYHTPQQMHRPPQAQEPPGNKTDPAQERLKRQRSQMLREWQRNHFKANQGNWTITAGKRFWKVDSTVLEPRWSWFAAAIRVNNDKKTIEMAHDDPHAIGIMLEYIYTQDLDLVGRNVPATNSLQSLVQLAIVADKYGVPDLAQQVHFEIQNFVRKLSTGTIAGVSSKHAEDAILALTSLRAGGSASRGLQGLQPDILAFLKEAQQKKLVTFDVKILLAEHVKTDPWMAVLFMEYWAWSRIAAYDPVLVPGGNCSEVALKIQRRSKSRDSNDTD